MLWCTRGENDESQRGGFTVSTVAVALGVGVSIVNQKGVWLVAWGWVNAEGVLNGVGVCVGWCCVAGPLGSRFLTQTISKQKVEEKILLFKVFFCCDRKQQINNAPLSKSPLSALLIFNNFKP